MYWTYQKLKENYDVQDCPRNDCDGAITGKIIINLPAYFDENPELRKQLGWVKHYHLESKEITDYDSQTQNIIMHPVKIDEFTIKDEYSVIDKTEEQMLLEELGFMKPTYSLGSIAFYE